MKTRHALNMRCLRSLLVLSPLALAACVSLAPEMPQPEMPVPATLPAGGEVEVPLPAWSALTLDDRARQVVQMALANNRDLRLAIYNVDRSRALLGVSRADLWPTIGAQLNASRAPSPLTGDQVTTIQAGLAVASYELDLFGKVRNANRAAEADLFGSVAARRTARLALITQTLGTYLTLAADEELLQLAQQTLATRNESLKLVKLRSDNGAASDLELRSSETLTAQAEAALAQLQRQRAQDENALNLLTGTPVPAELLPYATTDQPRPLSSQGWLAPVPVGVSSRVLLRRPDVIEAEQTMVAANANIGVARAAMFPSITLSGSAGSVSDSLSGLFKSGTFAWSLGANLMQTIFDGGRNRSNVEAARITQDAAVATYEKAIQVAFQEASDGLVGVGTWRDQVAALQRQYEAQTSSTGLTRLRLQQGAASQVEVLDAERSLFTVQQQVVTARLSELLNRLALYKALGGDEAGPVDQADAYTGS